MNKIIFTLCISATIIFSTNLSAAQNEFSVCGHKEHDSLELRAQASTQTYWRDDKAANPESWTRAKILGFNDFHGQLEARRLFDRPVGGAAVLAAYLKAERTEADDGVIIVHAGDHVGATPPVSALLQDEPAISFLNMIANKQCQITNKMNPNCDVVGTLGNHEFDEGVDEMLRLVNGGNHADGPYLEKNWQGSNFPYVAANVVYENTGKPVLPPYVIKRVKGMPIAFIGLVLKETPSIVTPTGVAGLKFLDEATTVNKYVAEIKQKGIRSIVVTIHQGTSQRSYGGVTKPEPEDIGGSIGPIVSQLDDEVDIIVSGHWHRFTNALMENKNGKQILVTQAWSKSTGYADIDIAIDPVSKDIVEKSAAIITPWADQGPGLTPDTKIAGMVNAAVEKVDTLVNRVIGVAATDILRATNQAGESALGNLIADAQRATMNTDITFMNAGGIRADMVAGEVTWGELFTIQPFNNDLVKMDLTGQQIVELLNQQWAGQPYARIMKPSGISYTWDSKGTTDFADDNVVMSSIQINANPIDLSATYSVTVNSFIAAGGDNYSVLTQGTNRAIGPVDLDALIDYIQSLPQPFSYSIEGRLQRN